ncbi:homologous-pairing protein 2 homolog [Agrilus planipennis]|uniref:Homologous-pairing protein 2 homolog n=1 Tax=Agrilus planipennis TaxID=224129 RepID=A0A7F5RN36_AGRPL|nr:homologous-pairing protein 2 homolog [Agrilus planipennis]
MASEEIYEFLKSQNRPYSANDILQNVGKDHNKSAVLKSLDKLVHKNKVIEKVYGKQKIYCIAQDETTDPQKLNEELREIDRQITEVSTKLKDVENNLQAHTAQITSLQGKMTTEEAKLQKKKLEDEIQDMKSRLKELTENAKPLSDSEKNKIIKEYELYEKEYKKRKRMCMDIVDTIMESYPKTKKHLLEDIGIETDEDVEFKLNSH